VTSCVRWEQASVLSVARADLRIASAIGALAALAYVAFGWNAPTDYDYYGRLAEAFLADRWWLVENPTWLNELVDCGEGRFCVVYPPLPALLAIPFVTVLPAALAQSLVAQLCGGASAGVLYLALRAFGATRLAAVTGALLSAFGTTLLFSSADGRAWYAAHAVAVLFTAAAFLVAARGGPPALLGAAIGLAALARLPVAAATPALALLLARRSGRAYPAALGGVVLGGLPFALAYLGYNVLRWGTPLDAGYARLIADDYFFPFGLFSPLYVPRHLYAIFLEAPDLVDGTWWFLRPHFVGMSLFLTTPAFLWVFAALRRIRRDGAIAATALAALLALFPDILHGTVGFAQFGYRFSIDAQPFLIALALRGDARADGGWRPWPSGLFVAACLASLAVNVYAAIAIIRFGYWQ